MLLWIAQIHCDDDDVIKLASFELGCEREEVDY